MTESNNSAWIEHARKTHQSLFAREEIVCDCQKCYGNNVLLIPATVKTHRRRYGRHSQHQNENNYIAQSQPSPHRQLSLPTQELAKNRQSPISTPKQRYAAASPSPRSKKSPFQPGFHRSPLVTPLVVPNAPSAPPSSPVAAPPALLVLGSPFNSSARSVAADSPPWRPMSRRNSNTASRTSLSPRERAAIRLRLSISTNDPRAYLRRCLARLAVLKHQKKGKTDRTPTPLTPRRLNVVSPGLGTYGPNAWEFLEGMDLPEYFSPPAYVPYSPSVPSINSALNSGYVSLAGSPGPAALLSRSHSVSAIDPTQDNAYYDDLLANDRDFIRQQTPIEPNDLPALDEEDDPVPAEPPRNDPLPEEADSDDEREPPLQQFIREFEQQPVPEGPDDPGDPDELVDKEPCAAFREPAELRNFYVRTYLQSAFFGATNEMIHEILLTQKDVLLALDERGVLPEDIRAHLLRFPLTQRALQRRLGLDVNSLITTFSLCPKCGTRRSMDLINRLAGPRCTHPVGNEECGGILYSEGQLYGKTKKRTPTKSFPFICPMKSIEQQLLHPGFADALQLWRGPDNEIGQVPPVSRRDWINKTPRDQVFGKISEGWGWANLPLGLRRGYDAGSGLYCDRAAGQVRSLVHLPIGLNCSINIDGFSIFKKAKYSASGAYLVINNLPLHLRFLPENMLLLLVIPGPKEPSGYEFNQILEPLVDSLIRLQQGVDMQVHCTATNQVEQKLVHASLGSLIVDYIARIKCNGHVGVKSELHFCLYCKQKLPYLSVPQGYERAGLPLRHLQENLQQKWEWLQACEDEKENLRVTNGVKFMEFDRIPGFYGLSHSPLDAMHLFHLGLSPWIFKDILLDVGMFNARHRGQPVEDTPLGRLNRSLKNFYFPSHCARLPPECDKLTSRTKSEQWNHLTSVQHILLFQAWEVNGTVPNEDIPCGSKASVTYKELVRKQELLLKQREAVWTAEGGEQPTRESCKPSRNPPAYLRNILRYLVAVEDLLDRTVTRERVALAQELLERMAITFTRMNIYLSPSFHYAMHFEPFIEKYGSPYNYWCYPFERANLQMQSTNNNGHGSGVLKATMARGFIKRLGCHRLLSYFEEISTKSRNDTQTIHAMLRAMGYNANKELNIGPLSQILYREGFFRGDERIRLANDPVEVNLAKEGQLYDLLVDYCTSRMPGMLVFGFGQRPHGGIHLAATGTTKSYSHVLHGGIRFGASQHYRGRQSRYGFIYENVPVLILKIYKVKLPLPGGDEVQTFICALVRRFQPVDHYIRFPWEVWAERLKTKYWLYEALGDPEVVSVDALTGVFALTDIKMPTAHCWITRGLAHNCVEDLD